LSEDGLTFRAHPGAQKKNLTAARTPPPPRDRKTTPANPALASGAYHSGRKGVAPATDGVGGKPAAASGAQRQMHRDDDIIRFDSPAAIREMRQRHASIGRRTLAVVSAALAEWETRIANGEALNMSPADIEALREIGVKMAREADNLPDADPIKPLKPN